MEDKEAQDRLNALIINRVEKDPILFEKVTKSNDPNQVITFEGIDYTLYNFRGVINQNQIELGEHSIHFGPGFNNNFENFPPVHNPANVKQVELSDNNRSNLKLTKKANLLDPKAGKKFDDPIPGIVEDKPKDYLSIALSKKVSQTETVPMPDTVLYLEHVDPHYRMFHRQSISTLSGKAKVGKTTVMALMIANALKFGLRILWIDTEQGAYYANTTQYYLLKIAGLKFCPNLEMYDFREFDPIERFDLTDALLMNAQYDLVVVDGVRDFLFDINSSEESTRTVTRLMKWSVDYNCHVTVLIHENKQGGELRGHIGTECENKSEIVLSLSQSSDLPPITIVKCKAVRGRPKFDDFFVRRDSEGLPYIDTQIIAPNPFDTEKPKARKKHSIPRELPSMFHLDLLNTVFENDEVLTASAFKVKLISNWNLVREGYIDDIAKDSISDPYARELMEFYENQSKMIDINDGAKNSKNVCLKLEFKNKSELVKIKELDNQLKLTN